MKHAATVTIIGDNWLWRHPVHFKEKPKSIHCVSCCARQQQLLQ